MPNHLEVSIKHEEKVITIIGTRFLVDSKLNYNDKSAVIKEMKHRNKQNVKILNRIKKLQKKGDLIIGAGDFNTARRENPNKYWSKSVLEAKLIPLDIKLYTPEGCSHQLFKGVQFAGCPDHLIASNCIEVTTVPYYWNFVEKEKNVYFQREYTKNIPNPYPDHGILIAEIKEIK